MAETSLAVAVIGEIPDDFRDALGDDALEVRAGQLATVSLDAVVGCDLLLVGSGLEAKSLATWLPSLRTANPTMSVVGIAAGSEVRILENWTDEIILTREALQSHVSTLQRQHEQQEGAALLVALLGPFARQIAALLALLAVWQLLVWAFQPPAYLLPSPTQVALAFAGQWDRFLLHLGMTSVEAMLGFLLGNSIGISLAILLHRYANMQKLTMPVLISIQAVPIVAFAPLLTVWLGTGILSKVAMAAIICFFPVVVNAMQAFARVEPEQLEFFRLCGAGFWKLLTRLLVPSSTPAIIAGLRVSAGLSVVGAIVAEMTGANRGLGYLILNGAYRLETDIMFVAMLLSALLGITFFHIPDAAKAAIPRAWARGLIATA